MKTLLRVGACAVAVAGARASQSPMELFGGQSFPEAWISSSSDGQAFGRAQAADFFGDGVPDVLQLEGRSLAVLFDVDQTFAPAWVAQDVDDACALRQHALDGRDALAVVAPSGLSIALVDPLTGLWTWSPLDSSTWAGARTLRSADLDSDGRADLLGVAADGQTVLTRIAGATEMQFSGGASFSAGAAVLDLLALQWDLDPALEFAVLTTGGVALFDGSGALLAHYASSIPGGAIARVASTANANDRLAWITTVSTNAHQWLLTLSPGGIDAQLDLGTLDVVACVSADADADGDDDLLLSHRRNYNLVWLVNQRGPQAPSATSFQVTSSGVRLFNAGPSDIEAPENQAWPALADLDGDGDQDVVFGCELEQSVVLLRGDWIAESLARPSVSAASYEVSSAVLDLTVDAPSAGWNGASELIADVWWRTSVLADNESFGVAQVVVPLVAGVTPHVSVTLPEVGVSFHRLYSTRIRAVARDAQGRVVESAPARWGTMALFAAEAEQLALLPGAQAPVSVAAQVPEDPVYAPQVVPYSRTRRFRTNQPPLPPQPAGS